MLVEDPVAASPVAAEYSPEPGAAQTPATASSLERAARPRRHRWLAVGGVVLTLGAGGALFLLWHARTRRRASLHAHRPLLVSDTRSAVARAALSAIDLRRRPPQIATAPVGLVDALRAFRRPSAPRVLPYVSVKRTNPHVGDTFGHWWIEIDGTESYGWWPDRCPIRVRDFLFGGRGALNGMGGSCAGGTTMTDPHHLEPAEHTFHPMLVLRKSDRRVRREIRQFAQGFAGEWRWSAKPASNDCRTFQLRLFDAVGFREEDWNLHTRGPGCPFLALFKPRVREFASGTGTNS